MSAPFWHRHRWRDAEYWDQIADPANKSRVVIVSPSQVARRSSLGIIDDTAELSEEFWNWADENRDALGNFYHDDLGAGWFDAPELRHLNFAEVAETASGATVSVAFLFPTEQAAMLFKMGFL